MVECPRFLFWTLHKWKYIFPQGRICERCGICQYEVDRTADNMYNDFNLSPDHVWRTVEYEHLMEWFEEWKVKQEQLRHERYVEKEKARDSQRKALEHLRLTEG